jgi:hypothetical protein
MIMSQRGLPPSVQQFSVPLPLDYGPRLSLGSVVSAPASAGGAPPVPEISTIASAPAGSSSASGVFPSIGTMPPPPQPQPKSGERDESSAARVLAALRQAPHSGPAPCYAQGGHLAAASSPLVRPAHSPVVLSPPFGTDAHPQLRPLPAVFTSPPGPLPSLSASYSAGLAAMRYVGHSSASGTSPSPYRAPGVSPLRAVPLGPPLPPPMPVVLQAHSVLAADALRMARKRDQDALSAEALAAAATEQSAFQSVGKRQDTRREPVRRAGPQQ